MEYGVDVTSKKDEQSANDVNDRQRVLALALDAVTRDRNADYGEPEDNFADIARLWNAYKGPGIPFSPTDVAVLMILVKIARISTSPMKEDHWVDIAGYAACGYQTARVWSKFDTHSQQD